MKIIIPDAESIPYITGEIKAYLEWPSCRYFEVHNQPERLNPETPKGDAIV